MVLHDAESAAPIRQIAMITRIGLTMCDCSSFSGRARDLCEGHGRDGRPDPSEAAVRAFREKYQRNAATPIGTQAAVSRNYSKTKKPVESLSVVITNAGGQIKTFTIRLSQKLGDVVTWECEKVTVMYLGEDKWFIKYRGDGTPTDHVQCCGSAVGSLDSGVKFELICDEPYRQFMTVYVKHPRATEANADCKPCSKKGPLRVKR